MTERERCTFCSVDLEKLVSSPLAIAFSDAYPVSPGHTLIIPRRHVATYFDCTTDEKAAIWDLLEQLRRLITEQHQPDGFNVGFNAGIASGQTVPHAHIHVIPRYTGDVADPRGGVRHAIAGRGYYDPKP